MSKRTTKRDTLLAELTARHLELREQAIAAERIAATYQQQAAGLAISLDLVRKGLTKAAE